MTAELCGPATATWTENLSTASDRSLLSTAERKPPVTSPVSFSIAAEKLRKWSLLILLLLLFPPRIHGSIIAAQCCATYGPIRAYLNLKSQRTVDFSYTASVIAPRQLHPVNFYWHPNFLFLKGQNSPLWSSFVTHDNFLMQHIALAPSCFIH